MRWHAPTQCVLAVAVVLALPVASFAQVKVLMSGGFAAAYQEVLPEFERTTGITVATTRGQSQGDVPTAIGPQLRRGVPADVVILSREGLDDLIKEGRITAGTDVDLAHTPLGVAVRAGAPKPDISTVEAFTATLRRAASVTFPSSTTGIWMVTTLFPKLGIADDMARKSTSAGLSAMAEGKVDLAIQPVSELLHVPGVDFAGALPAEIQYISVFSAALVAGSNEPGAARRLIAFLASDSVRSAIAASGMEPPRRK